jgi:ribosomal protein S18 acetylase RimI-like enzyme
MKVRLARIEDLDALMKIETASFKSDLLSRRQMRYHLKNKRAKIWVCEVPGGLIAGYLLGFFHKNRAARIYSVATDSAWQGRGFGKSLINIFIKEAKNQNIFSIVLEVRQDCPTAINLYEKLGFKIFHDLPSFYEDGCHGYKMTLSL